MACMNEQISVNQAHLKRSHYHLVRQRCWFGQDGAKQFLEPMTFTLLLLLSSVFIFTLSIKRAELIVTNIKYPRFLAARGLCVFAGCLNIRS